MSFTWSDEDKKKVSGMWESGMSASEIAKDFPGKTRNSIIGLLHRMGAPKRVRVVAPRNEVKRERPERKKKTAFFIQRRQNPHRVAATPVAPPRSVTTGEGLNIHQLRGNHCRDVIGYRDGELSMAVYCGAEKHKNTSFCEYHASIYCVPPRSK